MRPAARALHRTRTLERWGLLTGAAPAPRKRPRWVTFTGLSRLRLLENSPLTTDARRRPLRLLRVFLTREHLDLSPQQQLRINRLLYTEKLPGGSPLQFHQLAPAAAAGQVAPLSAQEALLSRLDRALLEQRRLMGDTAKKNGLALAHMEQERQEQDLASLLAGTRQVIERSDPLWKKVKARLVPAPVTVERLLWLRNGGQPHRRMTTDEQTSSLMRLLSSLGLKLQLRSGRPVKIVDGLRAATAAVGPGDVRLARQPGPGLTATVELFEAAGEALCSVHGPRGWELSALGQRLGARTLGHLLGLVWLEPQWLARTEALLARDQQTAPPLAPLWRHLVLGDLLRPRLVLAEMSARAVMDGHHLEEKPRGDPGAAYWLAAWQRLPVKPRQGRRYLLLMRLFNEPVDLRAYLLAHMLLERLRARHGGGWFQNKEVGPWLLSKLCGPGSVGHRRLARGLGFEGLDHAAPARNQERAWKGLEAR